VRLAMQDLPFGGETVFCPKLLDMDQRALPFTE
jgi:hypothetical protein